MYHGHPDERAEMRRTTMRPIEAYGDEDETREADEATLSGKRKTRRTSYRRPPNFTLSDNEDNEDYVDESTQDDDDDDGSTYSRKARTKFSKNRTMKTKRLPKQTPQTFPIVITTYEIIIRDRKFLEKYQWGFIVVDEGHRLKNFNCKLVQEIKKYPSASRMILTGTPLHVSSRIYLPLLPSSDRSVEQPRGVVVTA